MNSDFFLYIIAVAILITLLWRNFFVRKARIKLKLRWTKRVNIGDFADGERARVSGKVVFAGKVLAAPISGKKCIYYHTLISEDRNQSVSYEIADEEMAGDILIMDGNNYAWVDTRNMEVSLANYSSEISDEPTPSVKKFLARRNEEYVKGKLFSFFGYKSWLRYREAYIEEGTMISVAGQGVWKNASELEIKAPMNAKKILVLSGTGKNPLYLSDEYYLVNLP